MKTGQTTIRRAVLIFGCIVSGTVPAVALAQNYDNPGVGELPVTIHPQDFKPLGIRAGGFMLHPGVQLAAEFTDNVFYTNQDKESDTVYHVRPYITAQSSWSRHSFNMRLAADIGRHDKYGFRDYEDYFALINGRVDVRNRSFMSYNVDFMQLHEGLNNRNAEQGVEPTVYHLYGGGIGYDHTFNRLSLGGEYSLRQLDYDNNIGVDGQVVDNQDRNRQIGEWGLRAGYQFQTDMQAFARFSGNTVRYDESPDSNGVYRDSDGWYAGAGLLFAVTNLLDGDVYVGYHDQNYDDPTLPNVNGWAMGAGLQWVPSRLTQVGLRVDSSVEETTYEFASGYLMRLYTLRVEHELLRDLQISGQVSYRTNDYQLTADAPPDARLKDKYWQAGVGLTYFFNRYLFINAAYTYDSLSSNVPFDDYDVNKVWLTLSLER